MKNLHTGMLAGRLGRCDLVVAKGPIEVLFAINSEFAGQYPLYIVY